MFSGICAALAAQAGRSYHGDFLKEKGQITTLPGPKDATPKKKLFFYTKTSTVFILFFIQKQRVDHNEDFSVISDVLISQKQFKAGLKSYFDSPKTMIETKRDNLYTA